MSYCISITSTEHLPLENTLLVHYSITCSGTWDLLQNSTAYRNVCDDFWVVMYPNIQHPRHSDFPISVGQNSVPATFAWNYGGIQGIGPENFDPAHSFLTQLGIYNTDCGQTGSTGQTGTTGGGGGTTGSGGTTTGVGSGPIAYPQYPWTFVPGTPLPPAPGPGTPFSSAPTVGTNQGTFSPNYSTFPTSTVIPQGSTVTVGGNPVVGTNPGGPSYSVAVGTPVGTSPNIPDPGIVIIVNPGTSVGSTQTVGTTLPGDPGGGGTTVGGTTTVGTNNQFFTFGGAGSLPTNSFSEPNPVNTNTVGLPWTTSLGTPTSTQPSVINISNLVTPQTVAPTLSRPSEVQVGQIAIPNSNQYQGGRSLSLSSQPGLNLPENMTDSQIDIGLNAQANIGNLDGYLSRLNFNTTNVVDSSKTVTLTHLSTDSIIPSSKTILELPNDDVPSGEKLFISTAFIPPNGVEVTATITLWILDSQKRTILLTQKSGLAQSTSPLTLVYSANTYQSPTGANTILSVVTDTSNKVIGISSKKFIIRPALIAQALNSNDRLREPRNRIVYEGLPASVVDVVNITRDPITVYSDGSSVHNFILDKVPGSSNFFSSVAVVGPNNTSKFRLTAYQSILIAQPAPYQEVVPIGGIGFIYAESTVAIAQSDNRIEVDGEELHPHSHTVGIGRTPTSATNLVLSIGPSDGQLRGNKIIKIYLSDSYRLKPVTTTIQTVELPPEGDSTSVTYRHTVHGSTPYVSTLIGLLHHGPDVGYLGETIYSNITYVKTDALGAFTWTIPLLSYGDYFSILEPRYGTFNPYKNIVYTSKI